MKTVFNMLGGPGTGKSRSSTGTFSAIKGAGVNAEYVGEYVKDAYAWKNLKPVDLDQFEIFGEQTRREKDLFGPHGPDVIITDSPIWLQAYYASCFGNEDTKQTFESMCRTYYRMSEEAGVQHVNIWLNRTGKYNPSGRFQTEEEAIAIDRQMLKYLKSMHLDIQYCDALVPQVTQLVMAILKMSQPNSVLTGGCY